MDQKLIVAESFLNDVQAELEQLPQEFEHNADLLVQVENRIKRSFIPTVQRARKNIDAAEPGEAKDELTFRAMMLEAAGHQYLGDANNSLYGFRRKDAGDAHYRRAVEILDKVTAAFPHEQNGWYVLGVVNSKLRNKSASLAAFEKAIEIDPTSMAGIESEKARQTVEETKEGCFVATACYGNYDHPDVIVLRHWRDRVLSRSPSGRRFIQLYYKFSPALSRSLARHDRPRNLIRRIALQPIVRMIKRIENNGSSSLEQ